MVFTPQRNYNICSFVKLPFISWPFCSTFEPIFLVWFVSTFLFIPNHEIPLVSRDKSSWPTSARSVCAGRREGGLRAVLFSQESGQSGQSGVRRSLEILSPPSHHWEQSCSPRQTMETVEVSDIFQHPAGTQLNVGRESSLGRKSNYK